MFISRSNLWRIQAERDHYIVTFLHRQQCLDVVTLCHKEQLVPFLPGKEQSFVLPREKRHEILREPCYGVKGQAVAGFTRTQHPRASSLQKPPHFTEHPLTVIKHKRRAHVTERQLQATVVTTVRATVSMGKNIVGRTDHARWCSAHPVDERCLSADHFERLPVFGLHTEYNIRFFLSWQPLLSSLRSLFSP